MTRTEAKQLGYTHHAKMYGFSGYYQLEGNEFVAKWWLTDRIVEGIIYLDSIVGFHQDGFKILVGNKL